MARTYRAKRDDTWNTIAKRYGVDATSVARANGGVAKPYAGTAIRIPRVKTFMETPKRGVRSAAGTTGTGGYGSASTTTTPPGTDWTNPDGGTTSGGGGGTRKPTRGADTHARWIPGRGWVYTSEQKMKGGSYRPGDIPTPLGGRKPNNREAKMRYMLDPEKGTYYYWDVDSQTWKVGGGNKRGRGARGGASTPAVDPNAPSQRDDYVDPYPDVQRGPRNVGREAPALAAGWVGTSYGSTPTGQGFRFLGPMQNANSAYSTRVSPSGRVYNPRVPGLINWRIE